MSPKPDFFIVGAAKSGTTSLAQYVGQHPDVFFCTPKEPNFFAFDPGARPTCKGPVDEDILFELLLKYSVTDPQRYQALFAEAEDTDAVGEASVRYLYCDQSARRIAEFNPAARIIVILRNPVDRLYSHYYMNVAKHLEPATLEAAIKEEDARVDQGWGWDWHYCRVGQYAKQLRRYYDVFSAEQILVLSYDAFQNDATATTNQVWEHLGLRYVDGLPDTSRRHLVGRAPVSRQIDDLIMDDNWIKRIAQRVVPKYGRKLVSNWLRRQNQKPIPAMSDATRTELNKRFLQANFELRQLAQHAVTW